MPVVETEYQRCPSAVLSRATMSAHRGSSATDGVAGFGVLVGVAVIILHFSYCAGSMVTFILVGRTPILAFKSDCPKPRRAWADALSHDRRERPAQPPNFRLKANIARMGCGPHPTGEWGAADVGAPSPGGN